MNKFKVGDRVEITWHRKTFWHGKVGRILHFRNDMAYVELEHPEQGCPAGHFPESALALVGSPPKLEVGAFVTIGDGKDEWEVTYRSTLSPRCDLKRGDARATVPGKDLTVVRGKPEPKPDGYLIFKGSKYRLVVDE